MVKFQKKVFFLILTLVLSHLLTASYFMFNKQSRQKNIISSLPLDDAYVHFVYARNFAQYGKFWFNYNDPQTGATSPLWVIILSVFFKLGLGEYIVFISKILGIIFAMGISIVVFYIVKNLIKNEYFAFLGGLLVALNPFINFAKISGMEVMLFSFLALISVYFFMKNRLFLTGLFNGLAILARPEGYVLLFVLFLNFIILNLRDIKRKRFDSLLRKGSYFIIPVIILVLPYVIYCLSITGKPLPYTFYAKHLPFQNVIKLLPELIKSICLFLTTFSETFIKNILYNLHIFNEALVFLLTLIISLLLILPGIIFLFRKYKEKVFSILIFPWLLFFGLLFSVYFVEFRTLFYQSRYFIPGIPFLIIPAIVSFYVAYMLIIKNKINSRKIFTKIITIGILTVIILISLFIFIVLNRMYSNIYFRNTKNVYDLNVHLGYWVKRNIPQNAVIALHDAGAIPFISKRISIDLLGLNTFQIIGAYKTRDTLFDFLKDHNISYIITYPDHFDYILEEKHKVIAQEIYKVRVSDNSFFDSDVTVVYKLKEKK